MCAAKASAPSAPWFTAVLLAADQSLVLGASFESACPGFPLTWIQIHSLENLTSQPVKTGYGQFPNVSSTR